MATQPPSSPDEPLTLDEVKLNLRVDGAGEDSLIEDLIVEAREFVESETDLVLTPRAITETAASLGCWIDLAAWPVTKVVEIRAPYRGALVPLPQGSWACSLARRPVRILPTSWGWGSIAAGAEPGQIFGLATGMIDHRYQPGGTLPVEIDILAGFATPADVPARAKRVMHLICAHWYSNRAGVEAGARAAAIEMPLGVTALIDKLRLRQV